MLTHNSTKKLSKHEKIKNLKNKNNNLQNKTPVNKKI